MYTFIWINLYHCHVITLLFKCEFVRYIVVTDAVM